MVKKHPNQNQDYSAGYIAGRRDSSSGSASTALLTIFLLLLAVFLLGWIVAGLVPLPFPLP